MRFEPARLNLASSSFTRRKIVGRAGIAGVYQRHDWAAEKRAALDAWAAHVLAVAEGKSPTGNVVKLGRAG